MTLTSPIPLWKDPPEGPSAIKPEGIKIGYDFDDPRWNEPLVDLSEKDLLTKSWYAVSDGSNPPYSKRIDGAHDKVLVRSSVAEMCVKADRLAQEAGFRLLFVDGFRSPETQSGIYRHFENIIKNRSPSLTPEQLEQETLVYVTPGDIDYDDPDTWFVHVTGGSIDVLLYNEAKKEILDCGVGFDDNTPSVYTDYLERTAPQSPACKNRRTLYNAMIQVGFTNYPYEYFHFDYGTIIHSVRKRFVDPSSKIKAFYGPAHLTHDL